MKAFLFDRDGVVNRRLPDDYVKKIEEFEFIPEFFEIFKIIKEAGYLAVLVTNQQGIGKKLMTHDDLAEVHEYMQGVLEEKTGYNFDDIFYCSDLAGKNSFYRKPRPGMLLDAIEKWEIDEEVSWMAGDSLKDYQAGDAAGLKTALIGDHSKKDAPNCDLIFPVHRAFLEYLEKEFASK